MNQSSNPFYYGPKNTTTPYVKLISIEVVDSDPDLASQRDMDHNDAENINPNLARKNFPNIEKDENKSSGKTPDSDINFSTNYIGGNTMNDYNVKDIGIGGKQKQERKGKGYQKKTLRQTILDKVESKKGKKKVINLGDGEGDEFFKGEEFGGGVESKIEQNSHLGTNIENSHHENLHFENPTKHSQDITSTQCDTINNLLAQSVTMFDLLGGFGNQQDEDRTGQRGEKLAKNVGNKTQKKKNNPPKNDKQTSHHRQTGPSDMSDGIGVVVEGDQDNINHTMGDFDDETGVQNNEKKNQYFSFFDENSSPKNKFSTELFLKLTNYRTASKICHQIEEGVVQKMEDIM
jgi:hypothetical protein